MSKAVRRSEKAILVPLYEGGMTVRQIAAKVNVPARTVQRWLHEAGAKLRNPGAKARKELQDPDWLREQYHALQKTTLQIASELGTGASLVSSWLRRHGIERRTYKGRKASLEARRKQSITRSNGMYKGEKNPHWKGGYVDQTARERRSYKAKVWRDAVKARDNFRCVQCGANKRLHAHHIKHWHKNPELRYELSNGKTLCAPCHQQEHKFRFPEWAMRGKTDTSTEQPQG